jgi:hypothetical protein
MEIPITNEEKSDMEFIALGLSNESVSEGLQFLLDREKSLLEQLETGEMREITLHNMTILLAAAARITDLADAEMVDAEMKVVSRSIKKPENKPDE